MSEVVEQWAQRTYRGLWRVMVPWLKVPQEPPTLPRGSRDTVESFHPDPGFLKYLQFWFWIWLFVSDIVLIIIWVAIFLAVWWVGLLISPLMIALIVLPDIFAFIAIHLRYDMTWYVMTDRAIRIRRGIWSIRETTISFENVQNVKVTQGPIQRFFGISNIVIETAGSGGGSEKGRSFGVSNQGVIEGIRDARRIRDIILARLRESKFAGLGDEPAARAVRASVPDSSTASARTWKREHIALLREIRLEIAAMRKAART